MFDAINKVFLGALLLGVSGISQAGLIDVATIEITPSTLNLQGWLQLTEVIAEETGTGNDLALASAGATVSASSNYPGTDAGFAIDGSTTPANPGDIFHSGENDGSSFLRIMLAAVSQLESITLVGRTDCCSRRDFYNISIYDSAGGLLFSDTDVDGRNLAGGVSLALPDTSTAVAEPSQLALLGLGLLALIGSNRRRAG